MKLDLHTHCLEATSFARPDARVAERIVTRIKEQGLDGIAITDHSELGTEFACKIKDILAGSSHNEITIIIGAEVSRGPYHIVELYLRDNCTFRFIAHPGSHSLRLLEQEYSDYLNGIHGMEIENGNYWVDSEEAVEFARNHGLLLLSNSDAHNLADIGRHYNEIDPEELYLRANGGG
ncbi:PHP domain-containing protein [Chloroflexota bacterium]